MGRVIRSYEEGDDITPLVKEMTQDAINLFEGSAGNTGPSQFTDEDAAKKCWVPREPWRQAECL